MSDGEVDVGALDVAEAVCTGEISCPCPGSGLARDMA